MLGGVHVAQLGFPKLTRGTALCFVSSKHWTRRTGERTSQPRCRQAVGPEDEGEMWYSGMYLVSGET